MNRVTYTIMNEEGDLSYTSDLRAFAQEHSLSYQKLWDTFASTTTRHKGYFITGTILKPIDKVGQ